MVIFFKLYLNIVKISHNTHSLLLIVPISNISKYRLALDTGLPKIKKKKKKTREKRKQLMKNNTHDEHDMHDNGGSELK